MHHGNGTSVGRCHHVYLGIYFRERLFEDNHGKNRSACGHISGSLSNTVRRHHARTRIALRRTKRNAGFEPSGRIEKLCALLRQLSREVSGAAHPRHDIAELPRQLFIGNPRIKLLDHGFVKVERLTVYREHTRRLAYAYDLFTGQSAMYIAGKRCHKVDFCYVFLIVKYGAVEMRYAPALRNIEAEKLRELGCRTLGNGVSPSSEVGELPALSVKYKISVHHAGNAHGTDSSQLNIVFVSYILGKGSVAFAHTRPNIVEMICPNAVFELILPRIAAGRDNLVIFVDEDSLNSR